VSALARLDAGHADLVVDLCLRCLDDPPSGDEVRAALFDPGQETVVRGAPGVGIVATVCSGPEGYVRLLGVHPDARRRGHGSALLRAAEDDLSERGAATVQVGADPPYYLYPGVETTATAMLCLLERHRYDRVGANLNMDVDLRALPPDPGGHALATAAERHEVAAWMATHWPNWQAEALRALDRSTLVISRDEAGMSAFCAYDVNRGGVLGPVAVRGDLWGRGRGRPVLLGALHRMRSAGRVRAEVAWVGPVRPYATLGAHVSRVFLVYRRALRAP
jgi:GNAT superfamily N-acetyltransferase